nr:hypothetical protein [Tanacetum cinerariifolium]
MMRTPRKRVRTPVALSLAIEAAIADEIAAPPRKRDRLSPPLAPSLPPPSPLPSPSRKRSGHLHHHYHHCHHHHHQICYYFEGAPNTYEIGESSTANILPVTGELVHHTVSLARIVKQMTEDLQDVLGRARDGIVEHQNVDQSILYGVSADVDTVYSSKSGNGLDLV